MKRCPKCKDNKVVIFDSDNDWCPRCDEQFPTVAVEEDVCEAGCQHFYCGELKHDKNCIFYPESRTQMYDDLKTEHERFENDIIRVLVEINAEILKNTDAPNLGKKGCAKRLRQLLLNDYTKEPKEDLAEEDINTTIEELSTSYKDITNLRIAIDKLKGDLSDANQREYDLRLENIRLKEKIKKANIGGEK